MLARRLGGRDDGVRDGSAEADAIVLRPFVHSKQK